MGNIYCKKCGINLSYYTDKISDRKSCRIKGENDYGIPNYLHQWKYDYEIMASNVKKNIFDR